jgi:hypothetical protein
MSEVKALSFHYGLPFRLFMNDEIKFFMACTHEE